MDGPGAIIQESSGENLGRTRFSEISEREVWKGSEIRDPEDRFVLLNPNGCFCKEF